MNLSKYKLNKITFNVDLFHVERLTVLISGFTFVIARIASSRSING